QEVLHAFADTRNGERVSGDDHVQLACRAEWDETAQRADMVERLAQIMNERLPLRLSAVALGERALKISEVAAQLELRLRLAAQRVERERLRLAQRPGHLVEHAERAERVAVRRDQGRSRVKSDVRLVPHEWVLLKPRIFARVRHDENAALLDRMRTERHASGCLSQRDPDARLDPLAVLIDECDERDGRRAYLRREKRQVVKRTFGISIENPVPPKGVETGRFVP